MTDEDDNGSQDNEPDNEHDGNAGGQPRGSPARKRKIRAALVAAGGVVLLAGGGWFAYHALVGKYHETTDDATIQADG